MAIVGRTGSGKSSVVQALYRLAEPDYQTSYTIKGHNAIQMSLNILRTYFSCIPQQTFVFNDTVRRNIDPYDLHSDK